MGLTREEWAKVLKQARAEVAAANAASKEQKKTDECPDKLTLHIAEYSERSIVVYGDTKWCSDELKSLTNEQGRPVGKFNSHLMVDGEKISGWVFSKTHEKAVRLMVDALTNWSK